MLYKDILNMSIFTKQNANTMIKCCKHLQCEYPQTYDVNVHCAHAQMRYLANLTTEAKQCFFFVLESVVRCHLIDIIEI